MLRTAALVGVVLLGVLRTAAQAQDPPFGYTGDFYRISPIALYGTLPEDDVTVEAGSQIHYYFYTTDADSVEEYILGESQGAPVTLYDDSFYYPQMTDIESCPSPTIGPDNDHEMDTGYTNVTELTGGVNGPSETGGGATDTWWGQDAAPPVWYPDEGTRNDEAVGPYCVDVTITPNCGWIYGTVSYGGNGIQGATVKLCVGTQQINVTTSGQGGAYSFHYLPEGSYTVKATTAMGKQGQANASVTKGQGTQANIAVQ